MFYIWINIISISYDKEQLFFHIPNLQTNTFGKHLPKSRQHQTTRTTSQLKNMLSHGNLMTWKCVPHYWSVMRRPCSVFFSAQTSYWTKNWDFRHLIPLMWCLCIYFFTDPISVAMGERYGYRIITMAGGLFLALWAFLSSFAQNIWTVILMFGVLSGQTVIGLSIFNVISLKFNKF